MVFAMELREAIKAARGAPVGAFLGNIGYMIVHGDNLHSIVTAAIFCAVLGAGVFMVIELCLKRLKT
jgi:uncharacterized membrane protein YeaQ/YmgE (transglycosylase-associated protein family)